MRALLAALALVAGSVSCAPVAQPRFQPGEVVHHKLNPGELGVVLRNECWDWAQHCVAHVVAARTRAVHKVPDVLLEPASAAKLCPRDTRGTGFAPIRHCHRSLEV